jgi:hypothetical protein
MEGAYRFPLLRVKPAADRPRFRGNDGKRDCVETRISKNSFEALYPTLSQFIRKSLAEFCKSSPPKEDALLGSPISRLARLRFDPLGFQPLQGWGRSGRSVRMATRPFKIGPADSDTVCRNRCAEVG